MKEAAAILAMGVGLAVLSALLLLGHAQPTWMFVTTLFVGLASMGWGCVELLERS